MIRKGKVKDLDNMNKQDTILMIVIVILLVFSFLLKGFSSSSKEAIVYYEEKEILTIDLNQEIDIYEVDGYLGILKIEAGNGKIKVVEETSSKHLCSRQGYISNVNDVIICLPNKIVIKITGKSEKEIDGVV